MQDAMLRALERWPNEGIPTHASAWLYRVAHNLAVDEIRRGARLEPLDGDPPPPSAARDSAERGAVSETGFGDEAPAPVAVDDEIALMFLCCHPALPRAAQVALTLKIASGFTAAQIALAFLSDERTIAQRIVRAKATLRGDGALIEVPEADELPARLEPILDVLYLVFNEGYSPSDGETAVKDALCDEALRLVRLLTSHPRTSTPAAEALRALLCFQASRGVARRADDGSLLLLAEQDRARWDAERVAEGFAYLDRAARGSELTRFHLEAGVAAYHAAAASHAETDWEQIVLLYGELRRRAPSPVIEVNRAVAVGMLEGALSGLDELDAIPERDSVARYPYALAAYAQFHASLGQLDEARAYLERALQHQPGRAQRALLERKLAGLRAGPTPPTSSTRDR